MHPRFAFLVLTLACRATAQAPAPAPDTAARDYTSADVSFIQGMILHHSQALEMTALIAQHTSTPAMQSLGERITVSQHDEIGLMQRWLTKVNQPIPMPGMAMAGMPSGLMPGMLTPQQMDSLAHTSGAAFDTLFLRDMIQHHTGALTMVTQLFGTQGAAQNSEIFRFASDVATDQRAEIARMRSMLGQ